jgi:hypothetical protein
MANLGRNKVKILMINNLGNIFPFPPATGNVWKLFGHFLYTKISF